MSKPSFVEMAEKDMKFEAEWVINDIRKYAEKVCLERDFVEETFLKAFNTLRKKGGDAE
ncbi:MAG: hypothetical protein J6U23_05500 [Clostridiales bacterium]|nr:hypothetical protein [Clostridiales bacterium]